MQVQIEDSPKKSKCDTIKVLKFAQN